MQNPVGFKMAEDGSRAEMTDFGAVLTNPVALAALPHTLFAAFMMTAGVIISVAAWQLARRQNVDMMRSALRYGLWGMIIAFAGVALSGDQLSLVMVPTQPMKMAAAEAMFNSACGADASFSIFTLGTPDGSSELFSIRVPYLLALLSTHSLDGCVEGINDLNALYTTEMFPQFADQVDGNFAPILWVTYWSFRWMIGLGAHRRADRRRRPVAHPQEAPRSEPPLWAWRLAIWAWPASLVAILVGWIFTEMGRQPWIVFSLMLTEDGVSPSVPGWTVLISLVAFTLIYAALAVVEVGLIMKTAHKGPDPLPGPDEPDPRPQRSKTPRRRSTRNEDTPWISPTSGSGSSDSSSSGTSCSTGSTSASGCRSPSSARTTSAAARSSTRSARSGTSTRPGSSSPAPACSRRSRSGTRRSSAASTWRCC